jgi:hypothetical protein
MMYADPGFSENALRLSAYSTVGGLAGLLTVMAAVKRWSRTYINLDTSTICFGNPIARRERPLADIVAIQLIRVVKLSLRSLDDEELGWHEVNLVLNDPSQPRIGFDCFKEWKRAEQMAGRLAKLLGVPLVRQIFGRM